MQKRQPHGNLVAEILMFIICAFVFFYGMPLPTFDNQAAPQNTDVQNKPTPATVMLRVYDTEADKVVEMDMEAYLIGVLSAEMPASYEPEALKAQAVAARTYAYEKMLSGGCSNADADICTSSAHCQAYLTAERTAANWGSMNSVYSQKIHDAVYDTAGEIVVYDGKPILALFHSTSGGKTENVENVYSQALPYLRSVDSQGEEDAPKYCTVTSFTKSEFAKIIKNANANANISADNVQSKIGEPTRYDSGRVKTISIGGVNFSGTQMRKMFSLNSTNFSILVQSDNVQFTTLGYGHGVGMSQVGANAMAKEGANYQEILLHYYTNVEISSIKDD